MKQILIPLCLFVIVAGLFLGLGGMGSTQPNLQVAAGELNVWGDWGINPCKYTYERNENNTRVSTTISNLSDKDTKFDLGDGQVVMIPTGGNITHTYQISLKGQTERIYITKLATQSSGLIAQEALVLKIQAEGGDER